MNFCRLTRPDIIKESPDMAFGAVGRELGIRWGNLSQTEKDSFKPKEAVV